MTTQLTAEQRETFRKMAEEEERQRVEFEATTTSRGYTVARLRAAFEAVANKENWKFAIDAVVAVDDLGATIAAIEYFCGSPSYAVGSWYTDGDRQVIRISAPGYYLSIGS